MYDEKQTSKQSGDQIIWEASLAYRNPSFKNRTGPAVRPEKAGTDDLAGFLIGTGRNRKKPDKKKNFLPGIEHKTFCQAYHRAQGPLPLGLHLLRDLVLK